MGAPRDGPKPCSRVLIQALQSICPFCGGEPGTAPGVREFVLLLARIPLAVVPLNAPSEGPGRDFLQSCLKAEELWVVFAGCSPPSPAVCASYHSPTVRERQGRAVDPWGHRADPKTSLT